MRTLLLGLLFILPGAQACSIAYQEFDQGALDGDTIAATLGQDVVRIDLATGRQLTIDEGYFPGVAANAGHLFVAGQETLGADCSGDGYLQVHDASAAIVWEGSTVDAFDADGGLFAFVTGNEITVMETGTWAVTKTLHYPRGTVEPGPFGDPGPTRVGMVLDATNERLAVTDAAHRVLVIGFDETVHARHTLDVQQPPALAWHDGTLFVGMGDSRSSTFQPLGSDERWKIQLEPETGHAFPQISSGDGLWLHHGNDVVRIADGEAKRLVVPEGYHIGTVAGDAITTALLVQEATEYGGGNAVGIQRFANDAFGAWHERDENRWMPGNAAGFAWAEGPSLEAPDETPPPDNGDTEVVTPAPLLLAAGALLLARRRT